MGVPLADLASMTWPDMPSFSRVAPHGVMSMYEGDEMEELECAPRQEI